MRNFDSEERPNCNKKIDNLAGEFKIQFVKYDNFRGWISASALDAKMD